MYRVYALCFRTSQQIYVGKTNNLTRRLACHRRAQGDTICARAIRRYGWGDIVVVVLAHNLSETHAYRLERQWIADLQTQTPGGYNITAGGEGTPGRTFRHSNETRQKIAKSHIGIRPSDETRLKISQAKKGKRLGSKARERIATGQRGRKHSPETLAKIAAGNRSPERRRAIAEAVGRPEVRRKMSESQRRRRGLPVSD